jgi:hypothetical protein
MFKLELSEATLESDLFCDQWSAITYSSSNSVIEAVVVVKSDRQITENHFYA